MRRIITVIVLALFAGIALAGCNSGHGKAAAAASSVKANPTTSADAAQVRKIFLPCIEPPGGHIPTIHGAIACAKGKVPAVQVKSTRRNIEFTLGKCLVSAYQQAGSWAAFRTGDGWPACAQTAYNAALAAGGQA